MLSFYLAHLIEDSKSLKVIGLVTCIVKLQLESSFKLISREVDGLFVALQRWESVYA